MSFADGRVNAEGALFRYDYRNMQLDTPPNDAAAGTFPVVINAAESAILMTLQPGDEIGEEVHDDRDQFFRIEEGEGEVVIDGARHEIEDDFGVLVPAGARQPQGPGRMMHDPEHMTDMRLFHALFDRRADIVRQVTVRPDGVETLTESRVPAVAAMLQEHVEAMIARVREARPIHRRDPLFRELFAHAAEIVVSYERTATGVRVVESSGGPPPHWAELALEVYRP